MVMPLTSADPPIPAIGIALLVTCRHTFSNAIKLIPRNVICTRRNIMQVLGQSALQSFRVKEHYMLAFFLSTISNCDLQLDFMPFPNARCRPSTARKYYIIQCPAFF